MAVSIIRGDVREVLPKLAPNSFDCICTSPPFWGLRDYGCEAQIGLEPTLDEYLATMTGVCRELRRVLKPTGTFWLNIGDCYAGSWGAQSREHAGKQARNISALSANQIKAAQKRTQTGSSSRYGGLKPKDLCMVPNRLAILLQQDGWWVRKEIIWHKPNPMPESVTDRPTSAHEKVWLLTKSERYFYDGAAIAEEATDKGRIKGRDGRQELPEARPPGSAPRTLRRLDYSERGRNARDVWTIATQPFQGAHFATFPPELAERCIKSGSSEKGCCSACGEPWRRVINVTYENPGNRTTNGQRSLERRHETCGFPVRLEKRVETKCWQPSCKCKIEATVASRILDPFAGAGTTGLVADRLGRDCTLIDLNIEYAEMALNRIKDDAPLFAEVAAE